MARRKAVQGVRLSPYLGVFGAYKRMTPWLYTLLFVMVFGVVVGDRLLKYPYGEIPTFGVPIFAVLYGIYRMMTQAPAPHHFLDVGVNTIDIKGPDGTVSFRAQQSNVTTKRESFTFHSRYGSFTFPVIEVASGDQSVRLCVWDNRPDFAFPSAKSGKAPHYLVDPGDWDKVASSLLS